MTAWRRAWAVLLVPLCVAAAQPSPTLSRDNVPAAQEVRLPIGDGRWTTEGPLRGWVYVCPSYAAAMRAAQPVRAAETPRQPWFSPDNQWYYPGRKPVVAGDQHHHGEISFETHGSTTTLRTNSLPATHGTGIFPVQPSDPAYLVDRNPNTITAADLTFQLPRDPTTSGAPQCITNQVGVMVTGPMILAPLDAAGRDPGAWEVTDRCAGHPETGGVYHFHTPSSCSAQRPADEIVGWALDGHPITGAQAEVGRQMTSADLDECHGATGLVRTATGTRRMYRYVLTDDFPYSVACFKGRPARGGAEPPHERH